MSRLKFAIIGCGRISHKHIEALANNFKEAKLVSVCDIIPEKMDKDVEEYYDFMKQRGINLDKKINKYTDYKDRKSVV